MKVVLSVLLTALCASVLSQEIGFADEIIGFGFDSPYPEETNFHNYTDQPVSIDSVTIDSITDVFRYIPPDYFPYDGEISVADFYLGASFMGIGASLIKPMEQDFIEIIDNRISVEPHSSVRVVVQSCYNNPDWYSYKYMENAVFFILNLSVYASTGDVERLKIGGVYVTGPSSIAYSSFGFKNSGEAIGAVHQEINLYSSNGRLVKTAKNTKMHDVDTRRLAPGIYIVKIKGMKVSYKLAVPSTTIK